VLVAAIGVPLTDTLSEVVASWWVVPFATLVLGFPSAHLAARGDRLIVTVFRPPVVASSDLRST